MTNYKSDLIDIAATLVHKTTHPDGTAKAYLLDAGTGKAWVPAAAVEDNEDGTWTMPERLAHEKGLI